MKTPTLKRRLSAVLLALGLGTMVLSSCTPEEVAAWQRHMQFTAQRDGTGGYHHYSNCLDAVDQIFAGRPDHSRARYVVWRESRGVPTAQRPRSQFIGCAQLSAAIRGTFLKGSAYDAYYNVLALRDAVDHPRWGWCHWDIVNYCARGGAW